ncbi:hypothetical protein [Terriglobus albidus]|uniref:hypothetical protein n=1 Tax=Terriglobus albidus TaxID=1592106 RepID=UPI0021DF7E38|nr:hypothetical protein [Terriglobus albidus]
MHNRTLSTALLICVAVTGSLFAQKDLPARSASFRDPLKKFVRSVLNPDGNKDGNEDARIVFFQVPPKGKAKAIVLVYVIGSNWCGSGGCTLLILEPLESSFKVLGRLTIVQLPIWLLPSTTNGYPDIGVGVRGGRRTPVEYEAKLSFDGFMYPSNPSLPPAHRIPFGRGRKIIVSTEDSVALY